MQRLIAPVQPAVGVVAGPRADDRIDAPATTTTPSATSHHTWRREQRASAPGAGAASSLRSPPAEGCAASLAWCLTRGVPDGTSPGSRPPDDGCTSLAARSRASLIGRTSAAGRRAAPGSRRIALGSRRLRPVALDQLDLVGAASGAAAGPRRSGARRPRPSRPSNTVNTGVPSATASRFMVPPADTTRSA